MRSLAILGAFAIPMASFANILNANPAPNNGSGGIFMDLTPTTQAIEVFRFDTFFSVAGAFQVQVWTRPGTYVGNTASSAGWTLSQTIAGTSTGSTVSAPVNLTSNITIGAGQTMGVLLHSITSGNGIRYFGTGTTSNTNFSNADLALFSAHSRTGAVAFGGTQFTPRALAGAVHYNVVPEPATMAVLGLGVAAMLRKRRKA